MVAREFKRERMPVPWSIRRGKAARWSVLLLVTSLIPLLLWWLTRAGTGNDRFYGLVETDSETVGPVATARILAIAVQPGQRVAAGDVLVRLDAAEQAVDMAVQQARLLDYEQSTLRYRQTLEESERRCRQILQEAAVAFEAGRMNRARDEAELAALQAELTRLQPLAKQRLVGETELSALRPQIRVLEQAVAGHGPLLEALQTRRDQAAKDLDQVQALLAAASSPTNADPVAEALRGAVQTLRQAETREPSVLRATRAGIVSRIQYQPGDIVMAGEAVVRVSAERSRYVSGLLTQNQLLDVAPGDHLEAVRVADPAQNPVPVRVAAIEPEVMDLLDPFNPSPRFPVRGRRVRMEILAADNALVPGETVLLQKSSWRWRPWRRPTLAD